MKYTTAALLGVPLLGFALVRVTFGQPPAAPAAPSSPVAAASPDYFPMNTRNIKIPIKFEKDRKTIRQVKLYVARNGENTWYQEGAQPPDRESFAYIAKEDGIYWFTMVEEDLQGNNLPADLTRTPPDLKVIVDTVQPRVQFTTAQRTGDHVVIEWFVDDKNPDENRTEVHFRPTGTNGPWYPVKLHPSSKAGVKFPTGTSSPVTVRVTAYDTVGNKTEAIRDITASGTNTQTSTSMSPALPTTPAAPAHPITPLPPVTPPAPAAPTNTIPPPDLGLGPIAPSPPAGVTPPPAITPPAPVFVTPTPPTMGQTNSSAPPSATLPTVDPRQPVVNAIPPATGSTGGPTPVAVWTGSPGTPPAPTVEVTRAQFINYLAFDLGYEVESRGPSGISRLDLWVTRDDGKTWLKWKEYDSKGPNLRVDLHIPTNLQLEGSYGFRVVPVSGAGLSERAPTAGDAPDLRVVADTTMPQLDLFPPEPTGPDTLALKWRATDKNFGDDPITIEWSDKPSGPWQPATDGDVMQAGSGTVAQPKRLPNSGGMYPATGSFGWRVPSGVPPRVYLKVSARDAAGNVREVVTRDAILVDLVKPKAKISGIVAPAGGIARP